MTKQKKTIEKASIIGYMEMPTLTYSIPYTQRLSVETELFKLFPNGEYVYQRTKNILNHDLFNTSVMKSTTRSEHHCLLMDNFYQELFYFTNMHNIVIEDKVYRKAFFDCFGKKFEANSSESYKEILTRFFKVQTKKFYQYNPHLKQDNFLGQSYFDQLYKLLDILASNNEKDVKNRLRQERRNLPRKEYSIEMYAYYYELRNQGLPRIPAAENTFKKFYSDEELRSFKNIPKKIDSFIRTASRIRL